MTQFHELYTLTEGHIITPSELLANAKLPNYDYVKFANNGTGLHVESCYREEDGTLVLFNYYFDNQDRLQKLIMESGPHVEVLFERSVEVEKLRSKLKSRRFQTTSSSV